MGPSVVVLDIKGHWVYGLLANNIFSIGGSDPTYSVGLLQPFVNYNLPDGWFLTASPIITANWKAPGADVWTVPLGGGFGRLWRIGKIGLPVNTSIQAFGNVVSPNNGADWTLRLQVQLLLPKSLF